MQVLDRAGTEDIGSGAKRIFADIEQTCVTCQIYAQKLRRLEFTLLEDKDFNHNIYVDIFYINNILIWYVIDEATYFQSTKWLDNMKAETLWEALQMYWIGVYPSPPDIIAHHVGKNFMLAALQSNYDML